MKSKLSLICSIFQLIIGAVAVISFFIVSTAPDENITKWIITLLLAIAFVITGIIGIADYSRQK